jgi:hypothetical protein
VPHTLVCDAILQPRVKLLTDLSSPSEMQVNTRSP